MSENVRERIEGVLQACLVEDPAFITDERFSRLIENGTQNIISVVRDALLSEAAVEANCNEWLEKSMEYWSSTGRYDASAKATEAFRNGLEAALAAAGLTDTRREQGDVIH